MSNNGFKVVLAILSIIALAGIGGVVYLLLNDTDADQALTIEEQVKYSYTTEEINLDLADNRYVQLKFNILTNNGKARDEVELREFQFKNILIKETVNLTSDQLQENLSDFEDRLRDEMNKLMEEGEITDVYIVGKIVQ
ncbi:flagellar basal body-associated FliL family protein [Amphibacillus xylanus]|uniref:Flagellar protein FliL n=1 Tax=Amphibacillus xylanus (strain ATCC 51415 / DSM 6626 / JCM 7361 / LMG 17667 / NBRC 15112 / Ep01) TaxID=698758 RepID=K0IYV7_AMPXN|nr:flagellar basal body-associated FliL family protein [Amphibacillus xylanus]BAM47624.1 putative flagellar basal body-associated protein FliL [Amphibacillus xylanus NBRC 15112]